MFMDLTVAICTHNGAKNLKDVLTQLRNQAGSDRIRWEVLVIDNNSSDHTAEVVKDMQTDWPQDWPLRYCFEPRLGLAIARQRAIKEAQGQLVGFLDDDNLASPSWVAAVYAFGQAHPQAGAYGGRTLGDYETKPPENFERIAPFLAIIDRGDQPRLYEPQRKVLPPGAGLVVRKQAWLENVPVNCVLQGRATGLSLPGEDLEVLLHIQRAGWEIWYNPAMKIHHRIPRQRLEKNYLVKLCRGIGLSRYHTRMLSFNRWQWTLALPLYVANDVRKIALHLYKHGRQVRSDVVAACEMQLFISSLLSPFYFLGLYLNPAHKQSFQQVKAVSSGYEAHSPSQ